MNDSQVIIYTHRGCPGGDAAMQYMNGEQIPFRLRDVVKDVEAQTEFRRLGGIGTPLLVVGDQVLHGFDPTELEKARSALERSGSGG
jgi:glutaredoxin